MMSGPAIEFNRPGLERDLPRYIDSVEKRAAADASVQSIVNPITFALSCYPSEWVAVLEKIDALDATVTVTGHGPPLHDKVLLRTTLDVFRTLLRAGREAKQQRLSADEAKEKILPTLHDQMIRLTNDDPRMNANFKTQLVDWYLHRVYEELDGPLTDAIGSIPRS